MRYPRTIRITGESASSVRLLVLLLGQRHGFNRLPHLAAAGQSPDGELLIGDRALIKGQAPVDAQSLTITDLARQWFDLHRLPFVFARWVVRKDAPEAIKSAMANWLDEFKVREPLLVEQAVPEAARALDLAPEIIRRYFQVIRRSLDDRDICGQRLFLKQVEGLSRAPLFQKGQINV